MASSNTSTPPNKCVIFAPTATGKTAFFHALVGREFDDSLHGPTIGAAFARHTFETGDVFDFWDLNGLETSQSKIWQMHLRGTTHIIIGVSITSDSSDIARMESWIQKIDETSGTYPTKAHKFCVVFRSDLEADLNSRMYLDIANRYGFKYFQCSAKTGEGIRQIQEELMRTIDGEVRFRDHIDIDFEQKPDPTERKGDDHVDVDVETKPTKSQDKKGCTIQ